MIDEGQQAYQKRMIAAHTLAAKLEEFKAAAYELSTHAHNWDNQKKLDKELWATYHQADELRDALLTATNVAHYG